MATSADGIDATSVTVVIPVTGHEWYALARARALPSARDLGCDVVLAMEATVARARNAALAEVETPWVIHLDADDALPPEYLAAVERCRALRSAGGVEPDVLATGIRYWVGPDPDSLRLRNAGPARALNVHGHTHRCVGGCLPQGNWVHVGAVARTELVRRVGGWHEWPIYEDWDLWLRCYLAGAVFDQVPPSATAYEAWSRPGSRNTAHRSGRGPMVHRQILDANGLA